MQNSNPYAAPQSNHEGDIESVANKAKVYSPTQAALGVFLCGGLGTVYFLASNYKSMGNREAYRKTILFGVPAVIVLFFVAFSLPRGSGIGLGIAFVFLTNYLVSKLQFTRSQIEQSQTLTLRSGWAVLVNSLLCFCCLLVIMFIVGSILAIFGFAQTT